MSIQKLALQGKHNINNSMAASIISQVLNIRKDVVRESMSDFQNVEHRLENFSTIYGVDYINDSKATNVNSTWYALESMSNPTAWIVGGVDKGNDYSQLVDLVKAKVKFIIALGADTAKIHEAFGDLVEIYDAADMGEAVGIAYRFTEKGDTVLLFQQVKSSNGIQGIVDYAHTPDALSNVLDTISKIRSGNEKVITVVGCGGDRDRTKRPKMAQIAAKLSNQVIFTSDNPRSEDPQEIINEMIAGLDPNHKRKSLTILDRAEAIKTATALAQKGDIILVAGKGHETYQEIQGVKHHFDDVETLQNLFNQITE